MNLHEEVVFKRSKELPYDTNTKEDDTPMSKVLEIDSTHPYVQRENLEVTCH